MTPPPVPESDDPAGNLRDRVAEAELVERCLGTAEMDLSEALDSLRALHRQESDPRAAGRILAIINRVSTRNEGTSALPTVLAQALADRYLLGRRIFATRMSQVFVAWRRCDGLAVVIKHLPLTLLSEAGRADFQQETELLRRLRHRHIVPLLDRGVVGGIPYLVMEYVEGGSLRDLVSPRGAECYRVLRLALEVCEALTYIHDSGVVHLDIKPRNLLLDARDEARVADFGIARALAASGTGCLAGSRGYAASEQLRAGARPDARSDVYSLGVVVYQLLTGRLPSRPPEAPSVQRPRLPSGLDAALLRALAEGPEDRFASAHRFAAALAPCLPDEVRQ